MKKISIEELKQIHGSEGLVLQGCGGDLQEWVDGINKILTDEGILKNGSSFHEVYMFENEGMACLLFDMAGVNLDMGKLAAWRLRTHDEFGGNWLSDYLDNSLDMETEPEMKQKTGLRTDRAGREHLQPDRACGKNPAQERHGGPGGGDAGTHH